MLSEEVTFRLFLLLVLIANHIATPFDLRAPLSGLPTPYASQITRTTLSIYHGNVYHRLRHFRLIAGADGLCGTQWWGQATTA